ncbi:glycerol kinase GlpK [Indioceanicola profundi]|uniref:glycerol kinase GlpK n=1 Tax=Indioceanicola profundi TaxID=2220096 RepID=UPI000E6AC978|nr:glycerol kinase GlpK [Indioceanicola profundi]
MAGTHVLAIDQGTTSTRAILFDAAGQPVATAQRELRQFYPQAGWVEHDPEDIWRDAQVVCRGALERSGLDAAAIAAIGITNQRETAVLWDRATGAPVMNAIVWQDRRTAALCRDLKADGAEEMVRARTGLLIDPYFSATKLAWMLEHLPGARTRAERGELCFGTVDSWLLYRLTGGRVHATDASNASRTLLFNLQTQDWDGDLLDLFAIPQSLLPEVRDNAADFGIADASLLGRPIPVTGMAGDQQAATVGQACFEPGMIKSTYGTGCFALLNIGAEPVLSGHRLLTTLAYRFDGVPTFAIEGSIFVAGAAIQWLRDGLRIISDAPSSERLAADARGTGGVYMVPAFTGLGAPYWDPDARGALTGLTRDTGVAEVVRAALEAVAYQTRDLMEAMRADADCLSGGLTPHTLRVDGGMAENDWLMQFLADMLGVPVERPAVTETTALGAAFLAGLHAGLYSGRTALAEAWRLDRRFEPRLDERERAALYAGWQDAVRRVRTG